MFFMLGDQLISSDLLLGSEGDFAPENGDPSFPARVDAVVVCAGCGETHLEVSRTG